MESPYSPRMHIWANEFDKSNRKKKYETWRTHGTPDWLLIHTVSGSGEVHSHGPKFSTRAGDMILFEPHCLQSYRTDPKIGKWHLLWVHFQPRPHWAPWLRWPRSEKGLLKIHVHDSTVRKGIQEGMRDCILNSHKGDYEMAINAFERVLLLTRSAHSNPVRDRRIQKALDYLMEQVKQPFSLPKTAAYCGLSTSWFSHLFQEQMGISPQRYLEELRLEHAAQYLRTSEMSIAEIAEETGYASAFYLSNRFKKRFAYSPTHYRQRVK